CQHNYNTPFTF
nr:immunoglobulin light chain junction region [Macaca mulatta]MOW72938.1 immunoglobulin light chain junction region [Macaca mulatta]MOW73051.1 immunoglobulin light chain junction region [Macaca mulatta]MOW73166.1 immunoglobulin light chain junction region [Macaca mulatta]MOW73213.1 immunoglobulin light chain junction region [Macaca mulatta]